MRLAEGWSTIMLDEFEKPYMKKLEGFLAKEYREKIIYPKKETIFRSLDLTDYHNVKVVILGQDPYINPSQANGLAFAVSEGIGPPPSLLNIFKEIESIYGKRPESTTLEGWADQGVLLLNTVLTVRAGESNSHKDMGWEIFTDKIIHALGEREDSIIFMLWGASAINKAKIISGKNHYILTSPHPSPLSAYRGFFGCKHFSEANKILKKLSKTEIDWLKSRRLND
jgi:uracil-DNA glycosylase